MARQPRCSIPDVPHLVALRLLPDVASRMGEADRDLQQRLLALGLQGGGLALHAYCIGVDRTLLLLTPREANSAARLVQDLGRRLAVDFNRRHRRSGPLFSGRFRSTVLEPQAHLLDAIRYVEQLPMRDGVSEPALWRWSSAGSHCGGAPDPLLSDHPVYWETGNTPFEREARHRASLAEPLGEAVVRRFDSGLTGGWPVGDAAFLAAMAQQVARRLVPRAPGRPRRSVPVERPSRFGDSSLSPL